MKNLSIAIGVLQLLVGIGAIPAGLSMMLDPTGKGVGMSSGLLINSPFNDFFIPGLFLLLINGFLNVIISVLSFRNHAQTGIWAMSLGAVLCIWIIIQVWFIGFVHFLQPLFLLIGLLEILLGYIYLSKKKIMLIKNKF